jgi:hypothetical protein
LLVLFIFVKTRTRKHIGNIVSLYGSIIMMIKNYTMGEISGNGDRIYDNNNWESISRVRQCIFVMRAAGR